MTGPRADSPGPELEELLGRASKISQQAEAFHIQHTDEPVHFEANRVKQVETRESSGAALRIIKDGRIGFSSTSDFKNIQSLIDRTLETASFGPQAFFSFPSLQGFNPVQVYDPETISVPVEEMVDLGQSAIDRLVGSWPELLCDATVTKGTTTLTLINSRGGNATYSKSAFSVYIHGTVVKDTDMLFVSDGMSSCRPILDTSEIVESIQEQLEYSREVVPAPTGDVPVIFTPKGIAGALLGPLLSGFNGRSVLQGTSPLVGKLGQQMLDERLNVWDDPTFPYSPGSRMCDEEAVPAKKLPMVDGGAIANFFYDLQTSAQAGVDSTAAGRRGVNSPPSPGTSVIILGDGDAAFQNMIKDISSGLVVERLLGAGQSNILAGDFNANVLLGYRIEGGSVIGRVKNTVISGNVYTSLKSVRAIENKGHWVGGSIRTPSLCLDNVSVSAKDPS